MKKKITALFMVFLMAFSLLSLDVPNVTVFAEEADNASHDDYFNHDAIVSVEAESLIDGEESDVVSLNTDDDLSQEAAEAIIDSSMDAQLEEPDIILEDDSPIEIYEASEIEAESVADVSLDENTKKGSDATEYAPLTDEELQKIKSEEHSEAYSDDAAYAGSEEEIYIAPKALGNETRYTVLVLDTSDTASFLQNNVTFYTADTALPYVKQAAKSFLKSIKKASGKNYVAIVSYKETAEIISSFTDDIDLLETMVEKLTSSSNVRDISSGIARANQLLSDLSDKNIIKNTVLFTTGMTNNGSYSYSGHYDESTIGSGWRRIDNGVRL